MGDKSSTKKELKEDTADSVKCNNNIDYFSAGPNKEADRERSAKLTNSIQQECTDGFSGIGCFKGMLSVQLKDGLIPYQAPPRHLVYVLRVP